MRIRSLALSFLVVTQVVGIAAANANLRHLYGDGATCELQLVTPETTERTSLPNGYYPVNFQDSLEVTTWVGDNDRGEILAIGKTDHTDNLAGRQLGGTPVEYITFKIGKVISPDETIVIRAQKVNLIDALRGNNELQNKIAKQRYSAVMLNTVTLSNALSQRTSTIQLAYKKAHQRGGLYQLKTGQYVLVLKEAYLAASAPSNEVVTNYFLNR